MLGLGIVLIYVLIAIFAPVIAPHDPINDLYLADSIAAPAWFPKVISKYRGLPPTIRLSLGHGEWNIEQAEGVTISPWKHEMGDGVEILIPVTETEHTTEAKATKGAASPWMSDFTWDPFGSSDDAEPEPEVTPTGGSQDSIQDAAVMEYGFNYEYKKPQTFSTSFQYKIDAPSDAETRMELELITPNGKTFSLWDTKARGNVESGKAIVDARDLDLKMRLGISFFDEPTDVVFAQQGDYTLRMTANAKCATGPVKIKMQPVEFGVLGMVHGLLGTDHMGSDIWSQLVYGTRIALAIGLSAAFIAVIIGTSVGLIAGYLGGIVDEVLMRIVDVLLAVPTMPILIILGALFGKSIMNVVILLALFSWMGIARIVRAQTLSLKERTFVEAAKASGAASGYIMLSHILPNTVPLIFANLVLRIPSAILTEASLSFLGLGDPRVPTWGRILQNSRQFGGFTKMAWWWLLPPGLALTLLSLAFVFIGNSVNEILNPRHRERS
jgi:peptide/nickel transport system permease protein